jgi:oligopeptidase A
MSEQNNPLLANLNLPAFSKIKPEHIKPAIEQLIAECKTVIKTAVEQTTPTWENLVLSIDEVDDKLSKAWSPVSHLNSVLSSDEHREAYESCLPLLTEYSTWVGQHKGLYHAYKTLSESEAFESFNATQQKVINNALRDFKLSGIDLDADKQQRYGEIQTQLSELSSTFSNNVLDATSAWQKLITDESELAGLPDSAIAAAKQMAQMKELDGCLPWTSQVTCL